MMEELLKQCPTGWTTTSLSNISDLVFGQSPPSRTYNDRGKGLPFFQGKAEYGKVSPVAVKWCTEPSRIAQKEDILISVRAPVGPTNLASEECAIGRGLAAIRPILVSRAFIQFYLKLTENHLVSKGTGTTFKAITKDILRNYQILLAPLNEQKRIVDKIERLFSDLDEGEALLKTVQKQLATYRQSVLKAAVTGELTKDWREKNKHRLESGEDLLKRILKSRRENWNGRGKYKEPKKINEPYFKIPDDWGLATLDMISNRVTDGTHQSPKFEESGIPFAVIGDVKKGYIDWENISKWVSEETYEENTRRCRPEKGDILYTAVGSYGISLRIQDEKRFMFQRHIAHIKPIKNFGSLDFIVFVLNSPITLARAHKVARGVAQKTVTLGELSLFQIPLPSSNEQEEIVNQVDSIFSQIDVLEDWCATELARSGTLRQSILKDAFSGKLVSQDPKDEPASELLKRIQAERDKQPKPKSRKSKKTEAA